MVYGTLKIVDPSSIFMTHIQEGCSVCFDGITTYGWCNLHWALFAGAGNILTRCILLLYLMNLGHLKFWQEAQQITQGPPWRCSFQWKFLLSFLGWTIGEGIHTLTTRMPAILGFDVLSSHHIRRSHKVALQISSKGRLFWTQAVVQTIPMEREMKIMFQIKTFYLKLYPFLFSQMVLDCWVFPCFVVFILDFQHL